MCNKIADTAVASNALRYFQLEPIISSEQLGVFTDQAISKLTSRKFSQLTAWMRANRN